MKRHLIILSMAAALTVTACGGADEGKPRKGKYQPEVELTELDFPGMTDAVKEQVKAQMKSSFAAQAGGARCVQSTQGSDWKEASKGLSKSLGGTCETTRDNGTDTTADLEVKCTGTQNGRHHRHHERCGRSRKLLHGYRFRPR